MNTSPVAGAAVSERHRQRMRELVRFTASSLTTDFPSPFGSAVYDERDGTLVAQACDTVMRSCDPTAHAEINAIRAATRALGRLALRGCTLYSTCEPCPMCMSACIWAEVDMVVFGASTIEDADHHWPQSSDMSPQELVARMRMQPVCGLVPGVERPLCQELFQQCDTVRRERGLALPPHR
jgi:tRNA(Arg) A34 adenosine deaminase TadA